MSNACQYSPEWYVRLARFGTIAKSFVKRTPTADGPALAAEALEILPAIESWMVRQELNPVEFRMWLERVRDGNPPTSADELAALRTTFGTLVHVQRRIRKQVAEQREHVLKTPRRVADEFGVDRIRELRRQLDGLVSAAEPVVRGGVIANQDQHRGRWRDIEAMNLAASESLEWLDARKAELAAIGIRVAGLVDAIRPFSLGGGPCTGDDLARLMRRRDELERMPDRASAPDNSTVAPTSEANVFVRSDPNFSGTMLAESVIRLAKHDDPRKAIQRADAIRYGLYGGPPPVLKLDEDYDVDPPTPTEGSTTLDGAKLPPCSHSLDFTSVDWFGTRYDFSHGNQAESVRLLWAEWESGNHTLFEKTIGREIKSSDENFRLRNVFRRSKPGGGYEFHPAWGTMIQSRSNDGVFRLVPPNSD